MNRQNAATGKEVNLMKTTMFLVSEVLICPLSSNSKCNTTGLEGLRCCHAKDMLSALE